MGNEESVLKDLAHALGPMPDVAGAPYTDAAHRKMWRDMVDCAFERVLVWKRDDAELAEARQAFLDLSNVLIEAAE